MKKLAYIGLLAALFAACKPYSPPEIDQGNNPIFFTTGEVDDASLSLIANGELIAQSSFGSDALNVTYYEGSLATCEGCEPQFNLRWRSNDFNSPDLNSTVMETNPPIRYIHNFDSVEVYEVTLTAMPEADVSSYTWTVLGEIYTTETVTITLTEDDEITAFPAQLDVVYTNGCDASISDSVYLPSHGCNCDISARMIDTLLYEFTGLPTGGDNYDYKWQFEDGTAVSSKEVTYQFAQTPPDGVEELLLRIQTGDCRASRTYQQSFNDNNNGCAINFSSSTSTSFNIEPGDAQRDLGEVELEYLHSDGSVYQSMFVEQDASSYFKVTSTEEYTDAYVSPDNRSIKVEAEFNCLMSNGSKTIRISDGKLSLPLGLGAE